MPSCCFWSSEIILPNRWITMGTNLPSSKNNLPQKTYKEETTPFHQVLPKQPFPPGILTHPPHYALFFSQSFSEKRELSFCFAKCHLQKQGRKWMKVKHRWCQLNLYKQPRIRGGSTDPNEKWWAAHRCPLRLRPHIRATTQHHPVWDSRGILPQENNPFHKGIIGITTFHKIAKVALIGFPKGENWEA